MNRLISTTQAWQTIVENTVPLPAEACPLQKAAGRILREPIRTDRPIPPFNRVMMDGFAVRAQDARRGEALEIAGSVHAGDAPVELRPGPCAIRVATGCVLPPGADAVIPVEWTRDHGTTVSLEPGRNLAPGLYVHPRGSDSPAGAELVIPGTRLRGPEIGIAASCGFETLRVSSKPRLALAATGTELVPVHTRPDTAQQRLSNPFAIQASLALRGCETAALSHLPDTKQAMLDALPQLARDNNCLVLTGGASRGARDFVAPAFAELGFSCLFHGVRQKPGKPMGVWKQDAGNLVFCLPGNPASALCCFHRFVLPALCLLEGEINPAARLRSLTEPLDPLPGMTRFIPCRLDATGAARPVAVNTSGDYVSLARADGFLELPEGRPAPAPGDTLSFYPWA